VINLSFRVSSTLDKSVGKKHLVDKNPETCWTSQQGLPQYIQLNFPAPVIPRTISLTFQGGFVGTRCLVKYQRAEINAGEKGGKPEWHLLTSIYPEDVNRLQKFELTDAEYATIESGIQILRLEFEDSSDFFGRITVYDLQIEGRVIVP